MAVGGRKEGGVVRKRWGMRRGADEWMQRDDAGVVNVTIHSDTAVSDRLCDLTDRYDEWSRWKSSVVEN